MQFDPNTFTTSYQYLIHASISAEEIAFISINETKLGLQKFENEIDKYKPIEGIQGYGLNGRKITIVQAVLIKDGSAINNNVTATQIQKLEEIKSLT